MPAARGTVSSTASGCRRSGNDGNPQPPQVERLEAGEVLAAKPCGALAASASCFFFRCIVPPGLPACLASLLPGRGHARRELNHS